MSSEYGVLEPTKQMFIDCALLVDLQDEGQARIAQGRALPDVGAESLAALREQYVGYLGNPDTVIAKCLRLNPESLIQSAVKARASMKAEASGELATYYGAVLAGLTLLPSEKISYITERSRSQYAR